MVKLKGLSRLIQGLALIILVACEEPGQIGIDADPDNLSFATHYTKLTLPAKIVLTDSILSGNSTRMLVGRYADPETGTVEAKAFSQVWLGNPPTFPESATYDSLTLTLPYAYVHGAAINDVNDIKVFRVTEDLLPFGSYYTTSELETEPDPIGETSFAYVTDIIDGEEAVRLDTTFQMRLSDQLGMELFDMIVDENDTIFDGINNWLNWFKGISIESGAAYTTVTGFDLASDSRMTLHYTVKDNDGNDVRANYVFTLENAIHFNNVQFDRTGTPLAGLTEPFVDFDAADNQIYIQAGSGITAKVDFTPWFDYADSVGALFVNLARFSMGEAIPYPEYIRPPETVVYLYTDSTNQRLPDANGIPRTIQQDNPTLDPTASQFALNANFRFEEDFDPNVDERLDRYSDPVSSTVQAMADGRIVERFVIANTTPPVAATTVDRVQINPQHITLEVYYTISSSNSNE